MNGQSVLDLMQKRTSVRTYSKTPIEPDKLNEMEHFLKHNANNPFGANVRFSILKSTDTQEKLGTYGFIRGAHTFFAGCMRNGDRDLEGFGFAFEKAILYATSLGLGTCWLGGTFKRGAFLKAMNPSDNETLPAASPLGYVSDRRSMIEQVVAASAGARKRKEFDLLFFDGDFSKPLQLEDGLLKTCLEMVRIAPSASNKQPWRAVQKDHCIHFYLAETKNYVGNTRFGFCMQRIDLGIAACHFMLAAEELGLNGTIVFEDPNLLTAEQKEDGFSYSFSWV